MTSGSAARRIPLGAALLLIAAPAFSTDAWRVQTTLRHDAAVFAQPSLIVREGAPGIVDVAGDGGYRLQVSVTDAPDGAVRVATALQSAHGDVAPVLIVLPGEQAEVLIGSLGIGITVSPALPAG